MFKRFFLLLCPILFCSCAKLWQGPIAVKIQSDENAEITADKEYLHFGDTLTVTVIPKEGYYCASLEPKDFFTQDSNDKTKYKGRITEDFGNVLVQASIQKSLVRGVQKNFTNCSVSIPEVEYFCEDNIITFKVIPDEGYQIRKDNIKVTAYPDTYIEYEVTQTPNSVDSFSFIMPGNPIVLNVECIPGLYLSYEEEIYYVEKGQNIELLNYYVPIKWLIFVVNIL